MNIYILRGKEQKTKPLPRYFHKDDTTLSFSHDDTHTANFLTAI